jgi:hypothetical protein
LGKNITTCYLGIFPKILEIIQNLNTYMEIKKINAVLMDLYNIYLESNNGKEYSSPNIIYLKKILLEQFLIEIKNDKLIIK